VRATLAIAFVLVAAACDPVHDNAVNALGGEAPGVPPGPMHRPGQPCLLCHGGQGSDPPAFSMAGTVFAGSGATSPQVGAVVTLQDAAGTVATATTNAAGNFYLTPSQFSPKFPVHVTSVASGSASVTMHSHIGGNGSCAGCHADPSGPDSPGHVYFDVVGVSP
jgi:hypothetical protein